MKLSTLLSIIVCLGIGLTLPGTMQAQFNDIGIDAILSPVGDQCGGRASGQVVLKNYGLNEVTSAQIEYEVDGNMIAVYYWFGSLAQLEFEILDFPNFVVGTGTHTFKATTKNPNGLPDLSTMNDSKETTFFALDNKGVKIPFFEGFEGAFPPADWDVISSDNLAKWDSALVGANGNRSAFVDNYSFDAIGEADELLTPGIDLTKFKKVGMSFSVAYAKLADNSGFADTLEVLISGDCGKTFTRIWKKYGSDLATAPSTTSAFVPQYPWQWRKEWVDLTDYTDSTYVVIKFRNISNFENNIYIDNVNVNEIFALDIENNLGLENIAVYPNPGKDVINLSFEAQKADVWQIELSDLSGKSLLDREIKALYGHNQFTLEAGHLPRGVYMVRFFNGESQQVKKLVLN